MPTTGRSRLVLGLVVLAAAAGLFFAVRALSSDAPETPPPAAPASDPPTETASAAPSPPAAQVAQPRPFKVRIMSTRAETIDSSNMYGRNPTRRPKLVRLSARRAANELQRYLNTQFVGPNTRQTVRGFRGLLSGTARRHLTSRDRAALGLGGQPTLGGTTISANARATVVHDARAHAVTLVYTARMNVIVPRGRERLTQSGTMVFVPTSTGAWRADMVDVQLSRRPLPDRTPAGTSTEPGPEASEGSTP